MSIYVFRIYYFKNYIEQGESMLIRTKSTITLPLYNMKSRDYDEQKDKISNLKITGRIKKISFHAPSDEKVTIITSHIIEIRKIKRTDEIHKNRDGSFTLAKQEIIVKVQSVNNTYMIFAKLFNNENEKEINEEADLIVREITAAIDDMVTNSNPFVNISNQLEHRFNKITDTL